MMGHRDKLKTGDEWDAVTKAPLCVFYNNTGLRKAAKRDINRRARHESRIKLNVGGYNESD